MAAPVESKPEPEPAEPEFDAPEEDDFSIASVADHLSADDVRVAISVSPAGDEGSVNAVALARLVAEEGRKIVLIDLTGSACPTRLMTETADLAGITNLLAGEVPFTETIHADRLSDAHIIPQGDADPVLAMRGIERLQMIIDALANAYDTVLIECGPCRCRCHQPGDACARYQDHHLGTIRRQRGDHRTYHRFWRSGLWRDRADDGNRLSTAGQFRPPGGLIPPAFQSLSVSATATAPGV